MNFQILKRSDISPIAWDSFCLAWGGTLNHLTHFLDYYIVTNDLLERSFGVLFEGELVAVVPILLPISYGLSDGSSAINSSTLNQRPLVSFCEYQNVLTDFLSAEMFRHIPSGLFFEFSSWAPIQTNATNSLEDLFVDRSNHENLIVDLTIGEDHLFKNLSRGHQRTIKKSVSSGQITIILDKFSSPKDIDEGFSLYREAHAIAAGRITRPNESFELMLKYIHSGIASLFIGKKGDTNLSFLYCDFAGGFSRGWSQANSQNLHSGEFPRHQTEWEAMKYFSKRGVHYYHLGIIDANTVGSSAKSDSINEYKLRFHPILIKGAIKSYRKDKPND